MGNKFLTVFLVSGVSALLVMAYLFLSSGEEKIEATDTVTSSNGETIVLVNTAGYRPSEVTIKGGTRVKWVNQDEIAHTVTFKLGASIDNMVQLDQELKKGESFTFKFETNGKFGYFDRNSNFSGTVIVQ